MIVFDLVCHAGHVFEGWFASSDDHASQSAGGLIACPLCDDRRVIRAVTAAAIPAKTNRTQDQITQLFAAQRAMEARSQWVGDDFAQQARILHANGDRRCIHGRASLADAQALHDDGFAILPLPFMPKAIADS